MKISHHDHQLSLNFDETTTLASTTASHYELAYQTLIEAGIAPSTKRAYERDRAYFWTWMKQHTGQDEHYPVEVGHIKRFCLTHLMADSPHRLKVDTLRRYLNTINVLHQQQGCPSPAHDPSIRILLRRTKAAYKETPQRKAAITEAILEQLLANCDDSLRGLQDKAILALGLYGGGRRRSELANLHFHDLVSIPDGYTLTITHSKTDNQGKGLTVPITGIAAHAVKQWIVASGIRSGKLFRGIKGKEDLNESISGRTINRIVKRHIKAIGLNPDDFGAHSLRAGFMTSMTQRGISLYEIMQYSGHKDTSVASQYVRLPMISASRLHTPSTT